MAFTEGDRARSVGLQLALFLSLILCPGALAQDGSGADYTRTSQPAMLSYQELVALGEQETVDPALAAKLHTLLTTPFINNEAYFNGVKPLRPDLKGMGPSLRLVEWNIERGIEFDKIKLLLTDKQGFIKRSARRGRQQYERRKGKGRGATRTRWTCFSRQTCWY